jgi:hypothetical protein
MTTATQSEEFMFITGKFNQWAKEAGFYCDADIMRFQNERADDVILQNIPVGTFMPDFDNYVAKINYIVESRFGIY